jgi:N-acetylneuraminic acid mutarotase
MYVLGGELDDTSASVLKFDSAQGAWSQVAPMPTPNFGSAVCAVGTDIYVFGGSDEHHRGGSSVFKYDAFTDAWTTLAPMPQPCLHPSASVLDGFIYIVGDLYEFQDVLRFDPASDVWSRLASPTSITRLCAAFVVGGCLYAAGGFRSKSNVERYDVSSDTWTAVTDMIDGRFGFCAVTLEAIQPTEEQDLFDSLIANAFSHNLFVSHPPNLI